MEEGWSDQVAEAIFLDNVAMDRPYGERAAELADLRAKAGRLRPVGMTVRPADPGGADGGFGRFELMLDCAAGCLVAKAGCGPVNPMKIQSLSWTLEPKV